MGKIYCVDLTWSNRSILNGQSSGKSRKVWPIWRFKLMQRRKILIMILTAKAYWILHITWGNAVYQKCPKIFLKKWQLPVPITTGVVSAHLTIRSRPFAGNGRKINPPQSGSSLNCVWNGTFTVYSHTCAWYLTWYLMRWDIQLLDIACYWKQPHSFLLFSSYVIRNA